MKKTETRTKKILRRFCGVLCAAVLASFALLAACEQPEPEPEPPAPPTVNPDTLPANKFVGTWVLCAMTDVNSEPPATCDLADATTDTLVFTNDKRLTLHRGANLSEYWYEFTDRFLIKYSYTDTTYLSATAILYSFRENDEELILRGNWMPLGLKYFGFRRISND